MNSNTFINMLYIAIIGGIISSQIIQKIKSIIKLSSCFNHILSFIVSFIVGFSYAYTFYSTNIVYDIWIGLFTLIGAERMYQVFKGSFGLKSSNNEK